MMNKYKNYIVFGCQGVATWLLMCFICVCFYVIPSVARRFLLAWFKSLSLGLYDILIHLWHHPFI